MTNFDDTCKSVSPKRETLELSSKCHHIDISSVNHWKVEYHSKISGYHAINLNVHIWSCHVTIK